MKFWLVDKEKTCMYSIGKYFFSYENPELDINTSECSREELLMLFQSVRYGFLQVEDVKKFSGLFASIMSPPVKHVASKNLEVSEPKFEDLLSQPIAAFKSKLTKCTQEELKKLLSAEKKGLKRQTVINLINKQFKKHANASSVVKTKEDNFEFKDGSLISNMIESDEEEVVITIIDE